jgi:SAM-dependent methyltransferase
MALVSLAASTLAMTVPFFLSGVVVTLALTRAGGRIGVLYGWDLAGAAGGALLVVPLLDRLSLTSAFILAGGAAGTAAWCFARFAGLSAVRPAVVTAVLVVGGVLNGAGHSGLGVRTSKDRPLPDLARIDLARWNSHSFIVVEKPRPSAPFYWGPGEQAQTSPVDMAFMVIDGEAATALTGWNGDRATLDWVRHDVTVAPYYLRRGEAAIIGVGGGRDILSALWGGNRRVVGVEINSVLLDVQTNRHRQFANLANDPAVAFVHDEARSYFARSPDRYDVLQMSLIDTWAATGAGAFTLTENGLYTREAWKVFLDALTPTGVFSVSRWFNPSNLSESNRLLSLGVAALLDRGIAQPRRHVVMLSRLHVATMMVSPSPFTDEDRVKLEQLAADEGFDLLITPWGAGKLDRLERIAASRSFTDLDAAVADPDLDYSPPSDERPYFFNLLKLSGINPRLSRESIAWGNLGATVTLAALCVIAGLLVLAIILWPLFRAGRPAMPGGTFGAALGYFAIIGCGFMFVQIPFLQRFSVLLGHPTYTFAIVLASMIFFTGAGSFLSERVPATRASLWLPIAIALTLIALHAAFGSVVGGAARYGLLGRSLVVLVFTGPLSLLLGCAFPLGMRLVGRLSPSATAWMWGVNGACGVMASTMAVAVSMWVGIGANLWIAAALYALLAVPLAVLAAARPSTGL